MDKFLDKIKETEKKGQERIADAKKRLNEKLNAVRDNIENACDEIDRRAKEIIEKSVSDAESRAKARAREIREAQQKEMQELKDRVRPRMENAVRKIVEAFGKWQ